MWEGRFRRVVLRREGVAAALWGEPGIGKSHAAQRLLSDLPCRSLSLHATVPLAALATRLARAGHPRPWVATALERLEAGDALPQERAVEAIGAALAAAAPMVVHLEDLHEADAERLALVASLAAVVQRTRGVGLLVTSRSEPPAAFEAVRIGPRSPEQVARMLTDELGAELPAEAIHWITARAAGNPLFALEYLRFLSRQGYLWSDGRRWRWRAPAQETMPPSVEALVALALEGPRREGRLLDVMAARALLPPTVDGGVWAEVAGLEPSDLASAAAELERHGVFSGRDFAHPLYRDVLFQGIDAEVRGRLARRALDVVRDEPLLTASLLADAGLAAEEASALLDRAVASARAAGDAALVARLLAAACDHATGAERGRRALAAAQAFHAVDFARMHDLAIRAEADLVDDTDLGEARYLQALALATLGRFEAMQEAVRRIPAATMARGDWLDRYGDLLHRTARYRDLIASWEARPDRAGAKDAAIYRVGWAYLHAGDPAAAASLVEERRRRSPAEGAAAAVVAELEAAIAFYAGRFDDADRLYGEVLTALEGPGDDSVDVANALRNRAVARMQRGRYGEVLPDLDRALAIYTRVGHGLHYAQTLVMTSYAHAETGALERAEDVLLEAMEVFRRSDRQPGLIDALAQLSDVALRRPGPANALLARRYALEAVAVAERRGPGFHDFPANCALARARTATGDPAEGLRLGDRVVAAAREGGFAEAEVGGQTARAEALEALGRRDEARAVFAEALERARAVGLVLEAERLAREVDRLDGVEASVEAGVDGGVSDGIPAGVAAVAEPVAGRPARASVTPPPAFLVAGPAPDAPHLEVLGPMRVRTADGIDPVRGPKVRALLALLLEARIEGRSEPSSLELLDALYPGQDEAKAGGSLKQLVRTVRTAWGAGAVRTSAAGYALGHFSSDAERFLATRDSALWRGPYLEGVADDMRGAVADVLYGELAASAEALLASDPAEAARVARVLVEADPYDAGHLRLALRALRRAANFRTLARLYELARERFAELGERLPDSWGEFLAEDATD